MTLSIQGFQKNTLIDYPNKIASVIFIAGCNFKCKFCHNRDLVLGNLQEIKQEEIFNYLIKHKQWIDAVTITGGEPTIYPEIEKLIEKLKKENFLIKLDTNGSNPKFLKELLPLLDYIAIDIKTSLNKYPKVTGYKEIENIKQSIEIIKNSKIPYEFRATVLPEIFTEKDAEQVGELLKDTKLFILQTFQPKNTLDPEYQKKQPYSKEKIEKLKKILEKYIEKVEIR